MLDIQPKIEFISKPSEVIAYDFGFEDAKEGKDAQGSMFYMPGSDLWKAYNTGFVAGWKGDPACVAWMLEGKPTVPAGAFCGDFSDVMPWEDRADYVGM
jgi:hypothetical protein